MFSEVQITEVLTLKPEVLRIPETQRNNEEAAIAAVAAERAYLARQITQYYMGDTVSLQLDSVRYWISQVVTLPHQYVLVGQYLQEGDTIQTATVMNSIPSNFPLSQAQLEAHGNFEDLVQLKKGQMENGDWMAFALENEVGLAALAEQGISRGAIQAQHYYNFVFGETYAPVIEWTDGGSQSAGKVNSPPEEQKIQTLETQSSGITLEVIPNPARESVQFLYSIPTKEDGSSILSLIDPSGRLVNNWEISSGHGVIHWEVDQKIIKGIFLVSLMIDGRPIVVRRFSVID